MYTFLSKCHRKNLKSTNSKYFECVTRDNCFIVTPIIMKLHIQTPSEGQDML